MDSIEKLRILLKHWIDHNGGHVQEFDKWRDVMAGEDHEPMATALSQAMEQMDAVSATLQAALDGIGGPLENAAHHHQHHHHDDHDH